MKSITICEQCGAPRLSGDSACRYCGSIYSDTFEAPLVEKTKRVFQPSRVRPAKPRAEPPAGEPAGLARQPVDRFRQFTPWEVSAESGETLVGVIPFVSRPKGFLGLDEDYGVLLVTSERLIFAVASEALSDQMNDEFEQATEECKTQGSKNWRKFILNRDWSAACWQRYFTQPLEASLGENPLNAMIRLDSINAIEICMDEDNKNPLDDMEIKTQSGKFKFDMNSGVGQVAQELLERVLGDKVSVW